MWVAGGDGNDARLAVSKAEIYRRPRYQEYLELKRRQADAQLEDCLHLGRPRLMNGGQTVAADFSVPGNEWGHNKDGLV